MKKWIFLITIMIGIVSCDSMEDNYKDYLKNVQQYSPRITNLTKVESLYTIELFWDNPEGERAVKIKIDTGDDVIITDEMVDYYKLEDLEIKGYEISVYTIDVYGNLSVPVSISAFPGTALLEDEE